MRKNSIKNTRINGEVQKELSNIIRNEIKDPRIGMMTSVTAAEVAPDLKTCKVYISVFGDDEAKKETIRQQTVEIADKVVDKQMRIVQDIASLLGETAAETKIALTKLKETISDE